jgi:hypothetical protein
MTSKDRLEGKGKFIRIISVREDDDIDVKYFETLLKKAVKIRCT